MEQELYLLIKEPEVGALVTIDGFFQNAFLQNRQDGVIAFVNKTWYDSICYQDYLDSVNK